MTVHPHVDWLAWAFAPACIVATVAAGWWQRRKDAAERRRATA